MVKCCQAFSRHCFHCLRGFCVFAGPWTVTSRYNEPTRDYKMPSVVRAHQAPGGGWILHLLNLADDLMRNVVLCDCCTAVHTCYTWIFIYLLNTKFTLVSILYRQRVGHITLIGILLCLWTNSIVYLFSVINPLWWIMDTIHIYIVFVWLLGKWYKLN